MVGVLECFKGWTTEGFSESLHPKCLPYRNANGHTTSVDEVSLSTHTQPSL